MAQNVVDPESIHVWVHTWWGRDESRQATIDSLDASDLKGHYFVHRQPEGVKRDAFFLQTMHTICSDPKYKYSLRIEDDVIVNKHFLHNVCTWPGFKEPWFGAGFFAHCQHQQKFVHKSKTGEWYFQGRNCHFGGAVALPTKLYLRHQKRIAYWMWWIRANFRRFGPTTAVSYVLNEARLLPYIHLPSLAYIDVSLPSHQLGDVSKRYGPQPFDADWKRE